MPALLLIALFASLLGLAYAAFNFFSVKKLDEGTDQMREIASAIRVGANAFIRYEYKVLFAVVLVVAAVLALLVSWQTACCFLIGAVMSSAAGWIGMRIATYANVRVANAARLTVRIGSTLKVAFRGGSVMGLCVGGCALLGLVLVYLIFGLGMGLLQPESLVSHKNWLGIDVIPFTMCLSGYALGCSVIAMFNRIGGGIYTKAADMGADLVGKTEARIPEDDPRNPATIADNVGDNVGDVAGLGSDLLESYVGAISAASILAVHLSFTAHASGAGMTDTLLNRLMLYPVLFSAAGLIACVIGILSLLSRKTLENPHKALNLATYLSAGLTTLGGLAVTLLLFGGIDLSGAGFQAGVLSPWIGALIGIAAGIFIGAIAEFYTSAEFRPTRDLAEASLEGTALTITQGLALGMKSCMAPCLILGVGIIVAYYVSGLYGVAMAAVGMLSFVAATVSVDTYGPISDNAGGIAEMSKLDGKVREITDTLDSVGNTTAAIGKGFAIGSAAFATVSLIVAYVGNYTAVNAEPILNIASFVVVSGGIIGGALIEYFSALLTDNTIESARLMADEGDRQLSVPGVLEGKVHPDYNKCIEMAARQALKKMLVPSMLALLIPIVGGFVFGVEFVGGILVGATICAIPRALFMGNSGGAFDNAKKYIESGALAGHGKGSAAHKAAVTGDTVGDTRKDVVGVALDIFIKMMSTVANTLASVFAHFTLFG